MTFRDYLMTLNGKRCTLWIEGVSYVTETGRMYHTGTLEVHEDFILLYPDEGDSPPAFLIKDVKCIEVTEFPDDDEDEDDEEPVEPQAIKEDIFDEFERYYRQQKGEK